MDIENSFDRAIDVRFNPAACQAANPLIREATGGKSAEQVRDCAIFVTDTADLFWKAAQAVFGGKAKPEHALAMLDQFAELLKAASQETDPNRIEAQEFWDSYEQETPAAPPPTTDELTTDELLRRMVSSPASGGI